VGVVVGALKSLVIQGFQGPFILCGTVLAHFGILSA